MLTMLFTLSLLLVPHEEAGKTESAPTAQVEVAKKAPTTVKASKAHTEKDVETPKEDAAPAAAKPEPKPESRPESRPIPRHRAAAPSGSRLAEAEARAARLVADNARLQQEMAKAQGVSFAEMATPAAALAELRAGNGRFVAGKRVRTLLALQDPDLRATLAKGQAPFAIIVTCSDSRLADNLIFDQELGRLFTIREAGNSPDIQGLASAEYAAEHLGSKLVVVMGHSACGAVKAAAGQSLVIPGGHGGPAGKHARRSQRTAQRLLQAAGRAQRPAPGPGHAGSQRDLAGIGGQGTTEDRARPLRSGQRRGKVSGVTGARGHAFRTLAGPLEASPALPVALPVSRFELCWKRGEWGGHPWLLCRVQER